MAIDDLRVTGLTSGITGLIMARLGADAAPQVSGLTQIIGGTSSEIWSFDCTWRDHGTACAQSLILRRASETDLVSGNRADEFHLLRALASTPVPAPRVHWFDADGTHLLRPTMIMDKVTGTAEREVLGDRNKQGFDAATRTAIAADMARALGQIHAVDVAGLWLPIPAADVHPALAQLMFYDAEIAAAQSEPMPEMRLASLWLHDHLPARPARLALVHGDYRPANVMVTGGRLSTVLDWEFAHIGDPVEDLGWYLTSYYRHEHFITGHWTPEQFLAVYAAETGSTVDLAAVRFWAVFCLYKLASMTLAAEHAFLAGDADRMGGSRDFIIRPLLENTLRDMTGLSAGLNRETAA